MSFKRKMLPASDAAVGMVHPVDGPLARDGSDWTLDTFTHRRLHDHSVVFAEQEVSKQAPKLSTPTIEIVKPSAKVTVARPKIEAR